MLLLYATASFYYKWLVSWVIEATNEGKYAACFCVDCRCRSTNTRAVATLSCAVDMDTVTAISAIVGRFS